MPIILINKCIFLCSLLLIPLQLRAENTDSHIVINTTKFGALCIPKGRQSTDSDQCTRLIKPTLRSKELMISLALADEISTVLSVQHNKSEQLVLLTRTPSKKGNPTGYCGAGYEDILLLLSFDGTNLILQDKFVLQSCLKSIALQSDFPDEVLRSIEINSERNSIEFQWLTKPDDRIHALTIESNKFRLSDIGASK